MWRCVLVRANLWGPPFMIHRNWIFWTIHIKDLVSVDCLIFFLGFNHFEITSNGFHFFWIAIHFPVHVLTWHPHWVTDHRHNYSFRMECFENLLGVVRSLSIEWCGGKGHVKMCACQGQLVGSILYDPPKWYFLTPIAKTTRKSVTTIDSRDLAPKSLTRHQGSAEILFL